jgi:5-methylcytosine-specific restriction endonuclease McrA
MHDKSFTYERDPIKQRFYKSSAWRRCAASYAQGQAWICERCGNRNINPDRSIYGQLQVHHKIPITLENINDPNIALNHENLELLCITCHNKERADNKQICQDGYELINGRMVKA